MSYSEEQRIEINRKNEQIQQTKRQRNEGNKEIMINDMKMKKNGKMKKTQHLKEGNERNQR